MHAALQFGLPQAPAVTAELGSRTRLAASNNSSRSRRSRQRQIAACHRCLAARPLIPAAAGRQPPLHGTRGLSCAAVLKDEAEPQQRDAATPMQQTHAPQAEQSQQEQQDSAGVQAALSMLKFYKAAISPLLPPSCRFQPTCSGAHQFWRAPWLGTAF